MGLTPETKGTSSCGFEVVSNILPLANFLSPARYKLFNELRTKLVAMGYMVGINAMALPYDWRHSFSKNGVPARLEKVIKMLAGVNGKKVTIVAHSMGNTNVASTLSKLDQDFKDRYIHHYFAIAPPFFGAPTAYYYMLAGNDEFSFGPFGINFWLFKRTAGLAAALYDLMPRSSIKNFENEDWMKSIKKRVALENNLPFSETIDPSRDIVANLFPTSNIECFDVAYKTRSKN